jgi:hypothetical protein
LPTPFVGLGTTAIEGLVARSIEYTAVGNRLVGDEPADAASDVDLSSSGATTMVLDNTTVVMPDGGPFSGSNAVETGGLMELIAVIEPLTYCRFTCRGK